MDELQSQVLCKIMLKNTFIDAAPQQSSAMQRSTSAPARRSFLRVDGLSKEDLAHKEVEEEVESNYSSCGSTVNEFDKQEFNGRSTQDTEATGNDEFDRHEFNGASGRDTPDTEDTNTESETEGTWGAIMNEPSYHHIDTSAEISISMPTRQPVTRGDSTPDPPGLQTFQSHMEGSCKPCVFHFLKSCKKEHECEFCHFPHSQGQIDRLCVLVSKQTMRSVRKKKKNVA